MKTLFMSMAAILLVAGSAQAIERCGSVGDCVCCGKKNCRVVCEIKTVKKHCWVVECEQFCPTLPACPNWCWSCFSFGGDKGSCGACRDDSGCCDDACCEAGCGKGCGQSRCSQMVPPKCGKMRTRKTLTKKEWEEEVPVYKCAACAGCGNGCYEAAAPFAEPAEAPATVTRAPLSQEIYNTH